MVSRYTRHLHQRYRSRWKHARSGSRSLGRGCSGQDLLLASVEALVIRAQYTNHDRSASFRLSLPVSRTTSPAHSDPKAQLTKHRKRKAREEPFSFNTSRHSLCLLTPPVSAASFFRLDLETRNFFQASFHTSPGSPSQRSQVTMAGIDVSEASKGELPKGYLKIQVTRRHPSRSTYAHP